MDTHTSKGKRQLMKFGQCVPLINETFSSSGGFCGDDDRVISQSASDLSIPNARVGSAHRAEMCAVTGGKGMSLTVARRAAGGVIVTFDS